MGILLRQNDERSKLQERLAAELQERLKQKAAQDDGGYKDGVDDSEFIKNTSMTSSHAWIWLFVVLVVIVVSGIIIFS